MLNDFRWFAPNPQLDALVAYELTREFYREVAQREEFDRYCQWYYATAEKNRQELHRMQGDFNLLGWFCRKRH